MWIPHFRTCTFNSSAIVSTASCGWSWWSRGYLCHIGIIVFFVSNYMFCVKERILVYYPSVFAQFRHRHLCQRFCQHAFAWRLEDMFTRTFAENWYFNFINSVSIQIRRPTCLWRPKFYWFNNQNISTYILISIPVNILVKWKDRYISVTCMSSQSSSSTP